MNIMKKTHGVSFERPVTRSDTKRETVSSNCEEKSPCRQASIAQPSIVREDSVLDQRGTGPSRWETQCVAAKLTCGGALLPSEAPLIPEGIGN